MRAIAWGLPADFVTIACLDVIIGLGHTRVIPIFSAITVFSNIFSSYIFIFGKLGLPSYGLAGSGWGVTTANWISAMIIISYIISKKDYRYYFSQLLNVHTPSYLIELLKIGLPTGFMYCVEVAFFFTMTLIMGTFGEQIQAANQIALQYLEMFVSIIFSVSQAITVRMSHLLGAKDLLSAKKTSQAGIIMVGLAMTIVAMVYWLTPNLLISLDFDIENPANAEIIQLIKKFFVISAIFQIIEAARIAYFGALRSVKDTKFTLLTSIISFWGIAIPVGYVCATQFHAGGIGMWYGMVLGAVIGIVLLHWRLKDKLRSLNF